MGNWKDDRSIGLDLDVLELFNIDFAAFGALMLLLLNIFPILPCLVLIRFDMMNSSLGNIDIDMTVTSSVGEVEGLPVEVSNATDLLPFALDTFDILFFLLFQVLFDLLDK